MTTPEFTPQVAESVPTKPVRSNKNFYITFPTKYMREPHPLVSAVNPNGYAVIQAHTSVEAHAVAFTRYGHAWAFVYDEDNFDAGYHPDGCFEAFAVTGDVDGPVTEFDPTSTEGL